MRIKLHRAGTLLERDEATGRVLTLTQQEPFADVSPECALRLERMGVCQPVPEPEPEPEPDALPPDADPGAEAGEPAVEAPDRGAPAGEGNDTENPPSPPTGDADSVTGGETETPKPAKTTGRNR